ncbi:MAG: ATP-binding protein [Propionibacteriaceae bacterium]|jgi:predicted AAA+ superfamily ATPase|nr:ATP-binding protein [Propionibacteriaceae bacterium]
MDHLIERTQPLEWLTRWRDHDLIKVITGVRRCGKSTLLRQFAERIVASGVPRERIIAINLEDPAHRALLREPLALYDAVVERIAPGQRHYVFIDELQNAPEFERTADGLFIRPDVDLYVTGSNSGLLSGDLATLLSGRYVQLPLLPFSFAEYLAAIRSTPDREPTSREAAFAHYLQRGGFPYAAQLGADEDVATYLDGILATVLYRDVMERQQIRDGRVFTSVVDYLADNIGNLTTAKTIADTLTSSGRKISPAAVETYLEALTSANLVHLVPRYDLRGKRVLSRTEKCYLVDTGLRTAILGGQVRDQGRLLENVVYLELLRRGHTVRVGRYRDLEIDFVTTGRNGTQYIQVAETVLDENVLARELAPLVAVPDHYPRLLLTLDPVDPVDHDGITQRNITNWLTENNVA